jgi:hypothetical protein
VSVGVRAGVDGGDHRQASVDGLAASRSITGTNATTAWRNS